MKVSGPGRIESTGGGKKTARAADGFHVDMGGSVSASRPAVAATSVPGVDALLALQTVPDATQKRKRAVKRGHDLLDILNTVRLGLLDGDVSPAQVERLKQLTTAGRDSLEDPDLSGVLDEIDLRAKVELAKLGFFDC